MTDIVVGFALEAEELVDPPHAEASMAGPAAIPAPTQTIERGAKRFTTMQGGVYATFNAHALKIR